MEDVDCSKRSNYDAAYVRYDERYILILSIAIRAFPIRTFDLDWRSE